MQRENLIKKIQINIGHPLKSSKKLSYKIKICFFFGKDLLNILFICKCKFCSRAQTNICDFHWTYYVDFLNLDISGMIQSVSYETLRIFLCLPNHGSCELVPSDVAHHCQVPGGPEANDSAAEARGDDINGASLCGIGECNAVDQLLTARGCHRYCIDGVQLEHRPWVWNNHFFIWTRYQYTCSVTDHSVWWLTTCLK